ncbi:CAP domain-containing protein [Novosphingobium huizhouense]|uniref:CAP domain-containing protein n=1 Tax=Novosphingobium huizhouense TaxID=2866625 RepID=UPI001CD912EA|nr:CAP domain-containing protein [Novosphingobium huizhouense]
MLPRCRRVLAVLVLALGAQLSVAATGLRDGLDERLLAAHNGARARAGVPALAWNPALATQAQVWADRLAATGRFEHSSQADRSDVGENLWAGTPGAFAPEAMVAAWEREKRYFKPGRFPDNSTTGRMADVGHYTQLIWRDTGQVGCALAHGAAEDVLVCRYSSAGNYIGESPI